MNSSEFPRYSEDSLTIIFLFYVKKEIAEICISTISISLFFHFNNQIETFFCFLNFFYGSFSCLDSFISTVNP